MKETTQYMKTEIEKIRKTQAKGIIETEIMRKWAGTTNASMNSRIQEIEERLSSAKDTIEEMTHNLKKILNLTKA